MTAQRLIDELAAGRLLDLSTRRIRILVRSDRIPHYVLPEGEIRFNPRELMEWVELFHHPIEQQPRPLAGLSESA